MNRLSPCMFAALAALALIFTGCKDEPIAVTGVTLTPNEIALAPGGNTTLVADVLPENADDKTVTWKTGDADVATVSNGVVTAVANGVTTITVTTRDGSKTATCTVTVSTAATGVNLEKETLTLVEGDNETLVWEVLPATASDKSVTWDTSNAAVATVEDGVVTAVSHGTATITVTTVSGNHEDTCEVTVDPATIPAESVSLDITSGFLAVTETLTLTATVLPTDATDQTVTWDTSDAGVATVEDGVVTAVSNGTTLITVITTDGDHEASCTITVNKIGTTSFKTDQTWTVGGKVWSDVVMASGARGKTAYNGGMSGMYGVDLRENTGYGDMFSFELVNQNKAQLCPAPWSVPTKDDFVALDQALGGTGANGQVNATLIEAYKTTWGAQFAGICVGSSGSIFSQNAIGYFWSQTAVDNDFAYVVQLNGGTNTVNPQSTIIKSNGFTVRCVKAE